MLSPVILAASSIKEEQVEKIVQPLIDVLNVLVPVLLGLVGALGAVWVIFLGVKYAKAEEPQEHEKARNSLKNAIIGFVLIFVLLLALEIGLMIFKNWWVNYERPVI